MGAMNIDIIELGGTHQIPLLPQDSRAALNGIRSETFSQTSMGFMTFEPGPSLGPKCHGPHGFAEQKLSQGCPGILGQERNVMGVINHKVAEGVFPHRFFVRNFMLWGKIPNSG
jgi:hypothetical protein